MKPTHNRNQALLQTLFSLYKYTRHLKDIEQPHETETLVRQVVVDATGKLRIIYIRVTY